MTDFGDSPYSSPYLNQSPQDVLPAGDFLIMVCTNKQRLDALLSALSDYAEAYDLPLMSDATTDIIASLSNVISVDGLDCGNVNICEIVAACIADGSLDVSLTNFLEQNNYPTNNDIYGNRDDTTIVNFPVDVISDTARCSQDELFGQATQLTDYMHAVILDLMEALDLAGNATDGVNIVTQQIPILSNAIDAIVWLFETAADIYVAGYTTALRDEIRCGIYCLMTDDCELTFDELANYFATQAGLTVSGQSVGAVAASLVNIADGTTSVFALHALLTSVIATGGSWFGINGINSLALALALGADEPDNDWVLLCDDCAPPPDPCALPQQFLYANGDLSPCASVRVGQYFFQSQPQYGGELRASIFASGTQNVIEASMTYNLVQPRQTVTATWDAIGSISGAGSPDLFHRLSLYRADGTLISDEDFVQAGGTYAYNTVSRQSVSVSVGENIASVAVRVLIAGNTGVNKGALISGVNIE